ncbi:MAG: COX15/CtaA family protein, partial [Bacteroidota bacterium]
MEQNIRSHTPAPTVRRYRIMAGTTVGAVVFLILVGAVVRMTGSGMGCPDWPTCFGQWIPPTDISQLPADYKLRFAVAGKEIADFDAFKTWVEYVNRLLGVLIGLFSLGTVALSIPLRKTRPRVFRFSLAGLLAVLVVGGVGAYVVRTDLHEGVVTIHMVLALGALSLFVLGLIESYRDRMLVPAQWFDQVAPSNRWLAWGSTALIAAQVVMGTQVREEIDRLAKSMGEST